MAATCLVLLLCVSVSSVFAEIGSDCQVDGDCGSDAEFCLVGAMKGMVMRMLFDQDDLEERTNEVGDGVAELEPNDVTSPGICHRKMRLYDMCMMDNMCESGLCYKATIPGEAPPLKGAGRCIECTNDQHCDNDQFCHAPVVNAQCVESILLGLAVKRGDDEMGGEMRRGVDQGVEDGDMSEAASRIIDFIFQVAQRNQANTGDDPSTLRLQQRPVQRFTAFESTTYDRRPARRRRRSLSHFVINAPSMTCVARRAVNGPCRRSPECESNKCTVEGRCAL